MNRSRELGRVLLQKARGDAQMLDRLIGDPESPDWGLGFHAEQAVEKAIKAVLAGHSIEYPFSHDLLVLLELLRQEGISLPPDPEQLSRLTPFGALLRYDDELEVDQPETTLDRSWLQGCVQQTLRWAESSLAGTDKDEN